MKGVAKLNGIPPFEGVLLDLDGLLIDSETSYLHAWQQAGLQWGVDFREGFLRSLVGLHAGQVDARLAAEIGSSYQRERFFADAGAIWREHVAACGIACMPGAEELLAWLDEQRIPYALGTNSDSSAARRCLAHAGLAGRFNVMVCRDDVAAGKPEPDVYLRAAASLDLRPERCLVLEDSTVGLQAAASAGAIPVLVREREADSDMERLAHAVFTSLREVLACLA
ncbi:HAD family hydrolase [Methyloterricola oryzae]|uniref:HAD family hydrolase n=1 Tax=Methyloterricola oryzae TaxID=1495050 RepID=UPI0005EAFC79|nr:HAD family phosphatase [Methyloterricola oryzae]